MSHELTFAADGAAEMMYVGEKPWHGFGTKLNKPATSEEAIVAAKLDWEVEKVALKTVSGVKVPSHFAIMRKDTNTPLWTVGTGYEPVQNKQAFDFFDKVVGQKLAIYHTAGSLKGGRIVWILAKLPGQLKIAKKDFIDKYLLLYTAHDGQRANTMMWTPERVVCRNTLNIAMARGEDKFYMRHTKNVKAKFEEAARALHIVEERYEKFGEISSFLASVQFNGKLYMTFLNRIFPVKESDGDRKKRNAEEVKEKCEALFNNTKNTLPGIKGSAWAAFNSVTEYADHERQLRSPTRENHFTDVMFGNSSSIKQRAWDTAFELASK